LSDFYSSIGKTKWLPPNQDMNGYLALIDEIYHRYGNNVIYDIWNEPNHPDFWKQSEEDYFTIFKATHDRIRSLPEGGTALITGPSISYFDKAFIERFLFFCSQNSIKLDILSWHDFRTGKKLLQMQQDIKWARENWLNQYKSISIKEIHINEIIGKGDQYSPLISLMFFKALEEGGADAACKACWWNNSKSVSNCYNNSLDGLIDESGKPRSIWWAYKYYNMSTVLRLSSTTNSEDLISFAFLDDNNVSKSIDILLGINQSFGSHITLKLENIKKIPSFNNKKNLTVKCYEIPDTNEGALDSLVLKSVQKISIIKNNGLSVVFNNLNTKTVYVLKISPLN
jgi:xylan 1,4-beta-xylosidase